ncbi:MAG TPA: ferritin-like domain-containing protein [Burkholderiales bacterium]|nr:ferritin-like domain-containing protein [Burkholderiales bacterium]
MSNSMPTRTRRGAVRIVEDAPAACNASRRSFFHQLLAHGAALPAACALANPLSALAGARAASAPQQRARVQHHFESPQLELVRLLREACTVEHALMLQYLYAAFSVKPAYARLTGAGAPGAHDLIGVAIQEMQHLGSVNRLLVRLGAAPSLVPLEFPLEPDIYPFELSLEALGPRTLAKYVYTEAPVGFFEAKAPGDAAVVSAVLRAIGSERRPNHVGSLYASIIDLAREVGHEPGIADMEPWVKRLEMIKDEGEVGHFHFFRDVFLGRHEALASRGDAWRLAPSDPAFPSYALPSNPTAYPGHPNQIQDPTARALAWLGNLHYWSALLLLEQYYRFDDAQARGLALAQMMGPILSIGRYLPKLGAGMPFDAASFGASPALDAAHSRRMVTALLKEAESLTARLERSLPADYARDVARHSLAALG